MTPKAQRRLDRLMKKLADEKFINNLSYTHSHDRITEEEDTRRRIA